MWWGGSNFVNSQSPAFGLDRKVTNWNWLGQFPPNRSLSWGPDLMRGCNFWKEDWIGDTLVFAATCKDSVGPESVPLVVDGHRVSLEFFHLPFEGEDTKFYVVNLQKAKLCRVSCLGFFQFQNVGIGENCASFRVFFGLLPVAATFRSFVGFVS